MFGVLVSLMETRHRVFGVSGVDSYGKWDERLRRILGELVR